MQLFDPDQAAHDRDRGMELALEADRVQAWKDGARRWILELPAGATFTADTLVEATGLPHGEESPGANNAIGATLNGWARKGEIRRIGYTRSERTTNRARVLAIWQRR